VVTLPFVLAWEAILCQAGGYYPFPVQVPCSFWEEVVQNQFIVAGLSVNFQRVCSVPPGRDLGL
jgi:hypothetical protein